MSEENKQPTAEETPETQKARKTTAAEQTAPEAEKKEEQAAEEEKTDKKSKKKKEKTYTLTREQMEAAELAAKQLESVKDQFVRLTAEYDNYRKRTTKEKENVYADAKADTVKEFLGVLDNLERGLAQFAEGDPHRQGMELICRQFLAVLEKLGVTRIEAQGQPFDPQKHDAVMHVEDENVGENTVVEVLQQGYQLGDKVLRFAMVKVAN